MPRTRVAPPPRPAVRKEPLTRERIFGAALQIVDRDGLEALTMRSLGQHLGVEAMSLYHHVPNKAALFDGVVDLILSEMVILVGRSDWRAAWRRAGRAFWAVLQAHPNAIPLLLTSPTHGPNARRLAEEALRLLTRAGFNPVDGHQAFRIFQGLILGMALMYRARPTAADVAVQLQDLAGTPEAFPLLTAALGSKSILDRDRDAAVGLDLLIMGWEGGRR